MTVYRGATPLQNIAYMSPVTVDGFLAGLLVVVLISRVPAEVIFGVSFTNPNLINISKC